MAALSSQFAQISPGMSVETATDGLVSTMKAFHVDVNDVEREIMDNVNRIGNTMATSNEEIVNMLTRSSAAMAAANNTIEETIALESAAVQITRNAETTGTAFRTISMRIRGYDEETEEYIGNVEELTGKIADLTKTAKTPGGITLFTDETKETYKSTYQILKDISEIYHDLTDKQQAALLETLAGKRGGQVLAGILEDFSEVEKAMGEMQKAANSADEEMKIIEESMQFKLNELKQTWVGILQGMIDRGEINQIIEALTKLSEAIGKIIETAGPIPTLLSGLGLRILILNFDKLGDALRKISGFKGLKNLLDFGKGAKQAGDTLEKTGKAAQKMSTEALEAAGDMVEFGSDVASAMGKAGAESAKAMGEVAEAATDVTTTVAKTSFETTKLGGAIAKLAPQLGMTTGGLIAFGVAIVGVVGAIVAGAVIWDKTTTTVKETEEAIDATTARISQIQSELETLRNLDNPTAAQNKRIKFLETELQLEEKILEVEKKRNFQEKYDYKFEDFFDSGNAVRKLKENDAEHQVKLDDGEWVTPIINSVDKYSKRLEELQNQINDTTLSDEERKKADIEYLELQEDSARILEEAYSEIIDYQKEIDEANALISSGLFKDTDKEYINAQNIIDKYTHWIKVHEKNITKLERLTGVDTTNKDNGIFEGIFKKVEFKDLKEELVQLAKDGGLSADVLTSKYSGLVTELDEAGYSAEELIAYLNRLADPDMDLRRETATEIANSLKLDSPEMIQSTIEDLQNYFKENPEALKIASEIDFDISTWNLEDLKAYIEEELGNIEVEPKFTIDIDKQKKGIEALKEALSSNESLSKELVEEITEYFSQLEDFDASKLFIETSQGIRLNTEEVSRLRGELDNVNFTAIATELDNVEREYEETVEAMSHMNKASDEYAQKKADLYALQDRAKAAHQAAIEYSTLTSALKEFNDALATPKPSDDYASIVNQFDNIKKLADAKKFGLDEVKKYLQFFSYEDVDGKSVEELEKIYEDLYKVLEGTNIKKIDLLTVDDEGNATLEGISNFAKAINQRWGDAYTEFENGMWKFHLEGDKLDEVLKWGGLSTEFFESLLKVPEDWGYTILKKIVPVSEAIQMLEIDVNDAKEKLQQLGYVDIGFNLEDSTIGELNGIIQTLKIFTDNNKNEDGDININADGVREAIVLMNDLILRKQELEAQSIDVMHVDLDSSKMDEGLRNTIGIVQQLETDLQNLEKVKLLDGSDEEVEEAKQKIIDGLSALGDENLSQYVQQLNLSDLVNIDAENLDASIKDIKDKIASISTEQLDGEIVVKATAETNEITDGVKQATDEASQNVITVNTEVNDEPVKSFIDYVDTAQPFVHVSADLTKANTDIKNFLDQPRSITVQVSAQKAPGNLSSAIGLKGVSKARGGAMASGGKTLVGELGQEMVVDPNRGIYETVGDNGAEFVNLPKGAIVFNHLQTKNLLKGKNPGRGTALVKGNAMETGYTPLSSSGKSDLTFTYRVIPDGDAGFLDFSHMQKSLNGVSKSAKDAAKSVKNMGESVKDAAKDVTEAEDQLSKLSSELDDIQSAWKKLDDIQKSYAETGKITVDQAQELINTDYRYLAMLNMEGDAMTVNQGAFETLTEAKLNEMKITLIRNAIDLVNTFQDEAVAAEYVANSYLNMGSAAAQATAQVQALQAAVAGLQASGSATQAQAAGLVMQGTMNALSMLNHVDMSTGLGASSVSSAGSSADPEDSAEEIEDAIDDQTEEVKNLFNWVDRLLERLNRNTEKWIKRADRFISWWRKNAATDKAIKKTRKEAKETQKAYIYYQAQARASDLDPELKKKVEKGGILIENIDNDELSEKIRDYQTW